MPPVTAACAYVIGFPLHRKLKRAKAQLPHIPGTFRLILAASRPWTIAWVFLLFLQSMLPIALVFLSGALVDSIGSFTPSGDRDYSSLVLWAGLIVLVLLGIQSLNSLLGWVRAVQAELVQDHISDLIHAKAVELDLSFYDSSEYYDRLYRARVDNHNRPVAFLESLGSLLQNALTFLAMAAKQSTVPPPPAPPPPPPGGCGAARSASPRRATGC